MIRARRQPSFIVQPVKSIVNSPKSTGIGFWSINPYVGCEFGCSYCYARFAHRYLMERARDTGDILLEDFVRLKESDGTWRVFEQRVFVKQRHAVLAALEHDLARVQVKTTGEQSCPIIIGTATDPYQPAERRFRITKTILEQLLDFSGLSVGIITKSPLVCRDMDLLNSLGHKHWIIVYISLISTKVQTIKLFEARSPMPRARLRALKRLRSSGIVAGINAAPVLPGITDSVFQIGALMAAARDASAAFVHPSVIRLYPSVRNNFLPIVGEHFPDLLPRYRAAYRHSWDAPPDYVAAGERRFRRLACKHGVASNDPLRGSQERLVQRETQLSLL